MTPSPAPAPPTEQEIARAALDVLRHWAGVHVPREVIAALSLLRPIAEGTHEIVEKWQAPISTRFEILNAEIARLQAIVRPIAEGTHVRVSTELYDALIAVYEMTLVHGDFKNGNTDQSGSVDEGEVLVGQMQDRVRRAMLAAAKEEGNG